MEVLEYYSQKCLGSIGTLKSEMSRKYWNTIVGSVREVLEHYSQKCL